MKQIKESRAQRDRAGRSDVGNSRACAVLWSKTEKSSQVTTMYKVHYSYTSDPLPLGNCAVSIPNGTLRYRINVQDGLSVQVALFSQNK